MVLDEEEYLFSMSLAPRYKTKWCEIYNKIENEHQLTEVEAILLHYHLEDEAHKIVESFAKNNLGQKKIRAIIQRYHYMIEHYCGPILDKKVLDYYSNKWKYEKNNQKRRYTKSLHSEVLKEMLPF